VESFGARLKKEREQRKITLEEIAASTKIGTRFLRALEGERFDQLPGGIFNKGFVRAYARHLGIDEEQAIADYLAAAEASQPEKKLEEVQVPEVWAEEESTGASGIPWGKFAIGLLLVALGFAVWGFHSRESRQQDRSIALPASNRTLPKAAPAAIPSRRDVKSNKATASEQPASANPGGQPTASSGPSAPVSQTSQPLGPAATPGAFLVLIKARDDSWLTITADGKEVMQEELLLASGEKSVEARKEIIIKAGNVGGLDFSFNGKKLPVQGEDGQVKTLTFDADGLQAPPAKPQPPAAGPAPPQ
jgi:cytoskeleton protein RodZ